MLPPMSAKLLMPLVLGSLLLAGGRATAAEAEALPPSVSVFPAPPTVPAPPPAVATPTDTVSQPFRPAVRVPRTLPVNPTATLGALTNLVFDAEVKEQTFEPEKFETDFTFAVTNVSPAPVIVQAVRTSCGCTVAQMPDLPWTLKPGEHGSFGIHLDLRGKQGSITKSVFVMTDQGNKTLYVRGIIPAQPAMNDDQRARNMMIAKADRQAVFKGDCAACHATPTFGKTGSQLYEAACGICHEGAHRNEMVPDLNIAREARDQNYWRQWITNGKEGTLMPAFGKPHGGPLTDAQIISLAHFLTRKFQEEQIAPATQP